MTRRRAALAGLAGLIVAALAACAERPAPAPEAATATPPPVASPAGPSCAAALDAAGARFEALADRIGPGRCRLVEAVRLTRTSIPLDQPVTLACPMAERWIAFEREVVQPAAQRHLGREVVRVRHFGGYACRQRSDGRTISQHGSGNAIDVAGFDLAGGERVAVADHWRDPGPRGAFLREVASGACRRFTQVLTPKTDAAHRGHFHLDIGPDRRCDA